MKYRYIIIFIFLTHYVFAQRREVTLNNGSVIIGVVKTNNDSIVKVQTKDGTIWQYSKQDVKSIIEYDYVTYKNKIYSFVTGGIMPAQVFSSSLHIINGYRFNKHWQAGVGVGTVNIANRGYLPMFLHGQFNFTKSASTPFISAMAGYAMSLSNNKDEWGVTAGVQIGINQFFSDHLGLSTSIGYRYGYFKEKNFNMWVGIPLLEYYTIREINRLELRIGLVFR